MPVQNPKQPCTRTFLSKILAVGISLVTLVAFGKKPMEPLYDPREAASLKPYVYNVPSGVNAHLFPVPQDNAVGTNDLEDAITLFTFQKDRIKSKAYFKRDIKHIGGGGHYLPVFSPSMVGFAKERFFALYDFSKNRAQDYDIVVSLESTILQAGVADINKKLFLFEIESENPNTEDYNDVTYSLRLMDLSGEKPRLVKRIVEPKGSVWSKVNNQIFLCDFKKLELKVFTSNLEPSHHPLVNVIEKNKGKVDFVRIVPHPTLPFAVLYGGEDGAQYLCWNQTFRDEQPRIFFDTMNTLFYTFSPDGRWVVFQKVEPEPKYSYLMPVSEKYPNYLGSPILLEGATFDRDRFAWTNNPVNLVGSADGKLYRYDLTKDGHPESGDKPTYWEYVVEKDLEKLRQQGRQGLKPIKP